MSEEVLLFLAPAIKYILELLFDPLVFSVIAVSLFLYKLLPTTDPKLVVGSKTGPDGKTPVSGNVAGRQVWRPKGDVVELPAFSASENPNAGDKLLRKLLVEGKKIPSGGNGGNIDKALRQAVDYYKLLQSVRDGMIVYLRNHQQYDGGWGIHIEEGSTMFGTVLNYVALRLLGAAADDEACLEARTFIKHHGGATLVPSWGKFWLAVLNVYDWRGVDALPPEMWLLPRWLPFHPGRTWVHCRMVYLPMSYLYGIRFQAKETPLIQAIRDEIYTTPYQSVSWRNARGAYSKMDEYHTPSPIIRTLNYLLSWYELLPTVTSLRKHGLEYTLAFVRADDEESNYCNIGPVNKMINMLVQWVVDPDSDEFKRHAQRVEDYIWVAEDGVKMQGYVGSQTWDSSFAVQAFVDAGVAADPAFQTTFKLAYRFLTEAQNVHDPKDAATWWRRVQKGGWGFGIASNGYPVSDCTAEAVKALLLMEERANLPAFPDDRLRDAVDFILALQNSDGTVCFDWYEHLNPAVVFGAIMHDYSYVECSSSSLSALQAFHARHPTYRPEAIKRATTKADTFIRSLQYQDGSFFGKWGVCYTYGTMFAIKGMRAAGASDTDEDVQDAVSFLVNKQRNDGGWSESFFACSTRRYLETPSSLVVNTAWALIERISGVFNRTCGITYANYRNIFPIWAIGLYQKLQRTK
ncbi:hypothetical protein DYB32_006704 [Aphanomyces invadans]|uniref:Terpene cyclase/mutase family member n=1 Tax=Aphanomyces invadans TaxID=157072 RepID=A0A3R6WJ41_9STRA|nr:hypothetical protein DYB32_006704 [Aphanomyces invadans]